MRRVSDIEAAEGSSGAVYGSGEGQSLFRFERSESVGPDRPCRPAEVPGAARAHWLREHVLPHEPWLRRWLQRRGLDQDVEDIVQESYALLIQAERVDHVRHPRNYFCQTARSVILRKARRDAIVRIECTACGEMPDLACDSPLPDREVEARQELARVLASIDALPARTRSVFMLRRIEGLSLNATADRLGISQSSVEKHLRAAMRMLAELSGRAAAIA